MKQTTAHHLFSSVCGSTSIGARGQLVVPKEARDLLKIKPGDRFLVLEHDGLLLLVPDETLMKMANTITKAIGRWPNLLVKSKNK